MFNPTVAAGDSTSDPDSLRNNVIAANGNSDTTNIFNLAAGTYTLTIGNTTGQENAAMEGDLDLTAAGKTYTFVGQGAGVTIISGNVLDRVFHAFSDVTVVFQNLTITAGLAQDDGSDGAAAGSTAALGGGILSTNATITLEGVTLTENVAQGGAGTTGTIGTAGGGSGGTGGAGQDAQGGGLHATMGTVTVLTSTVSGNQAVGGNGGTGGQGGAGDMSTAGGAGGAGGAAGAGGTAGGGGGSSGCGCALARGGPGSKKNAATVSGAAFFAIGLLLRGTRRRK